MGFFSRHCNGVSTSQPPTFIIVTRENAIRSVSKPPYTCGRLLRESVLFAYKPWKSSRSACVIVTTASLGVILKKKKNPKNKRRTESVVVDVVRDKNAITTRSQRATTTIGFSNPFSSRTIPQMISSGPRNESIAVSGTIKQPSIVNATESEGELMLSE